MRVRGWRLFALLAALYAAVVVATRLLTLRVVHADAAFALQLVAVPLAQGAALLAAARIAGGGRR